MTTQNFDTARTAAINDATSDANIEFVRQEYEAFNAGDIKTLVKLFDQNTEWRTAGPRSRAPAIEGRATSRVR